MKASLARFNIPILDDLLHHLLTVHQAADPREVDKDHRGSSTMAISQLPINHWPEGLAEIYDPAS